MVTLRYRCVGETKLNAFDKVAAAMQFAVTLIQKSDGQISELGIIGDAGEILFTGDEIVKLSKQVRLP